MDSKDNRILSIEVTAVITFGVNLAKD
ncbi:hypothetical protein [Collimonas pratensis]